VFQKKDPTEYGGFEASEIFAKIKNNIRKNKWRTLKEHNKNKTEYK
jgi:hypothetical protein